VAKHSTRKVTVTPIRNVKRHVRSLNPFFLLLLRMQVPEELLCPITLVPMTDPVIGSDGRTYERSAITAWLKDHKTSPITREPMSPSSLKPNYAVKAMTDRYNSNTMTIVPVQPPHQIVTYSYQSLPEAAPLVIQPPNPNHKKLIQALCIGLAGVIILIIIMRYLF
jgi:hypothetical protein